MSPDSPVTNCVPQASTPVASPCTNVCRIDAVSGYCLGCWRDLDEIAVWSAASDDVRRAILEGLPLRRAQGRCP